MSAPSKRRRASFYLSLPIVVAVVFLLVAKLVAMQRDDIIAGLTDCIAHRETADATAAVRQLGAMSRPPAGVLVMAAVSADREVAREGQRSISKLLRRLQQQLDSGTREKVVARQISELATALADERDEFDRVDYAWLGATTQRILRMANDVPQAHTPLVASHCDEILATITKAELAASNARQSSPAPENKNNLDASEQATSEANFARAPASQRDSTSSAEPPHADEHVSVPRSMSPAGASDSTWHKSWSQPVYRIIPAMPPNALPTNAAPSPLSPSEPDGEHMELKRLDHPMAELDTRTLIGKWLAADSKRPELERELSQRGFNRLSLPLVTSYLSPKTSDRLHLVDDVLADANLDARPWLILLADDADADVRLSAVTAMATSNDPELVEKAWQTAIRDRDPRIAELAGRLRERRAATQRR